MGAGRFVCVALPFALSVASLIFILIAMLAGITDKNLDMFDLRTQNLSISTSSLQNFEDLTRRADHFSALTIAALTPSTAGAINITASDLGLADSYKVSLWNVCSTTGSNTTCSKAKFNWAASALNTTALTSLVSSTGVNVTLPKEVTSALHTYSVVNKWTEVVYIIAFVVTVVELVVGFFALCSRVGSCLTFIISGISTVAIGVASTMATIQSSAVVGTLNSVAKAYGVHASVNTSFLAITWVAVAFSLAGGLFWMFSICCCGNSHHSNNKRSRNLDQEKVIPTGAYQRVEDPFHANGTSYAGQQHGIYNGQAQQPAYGVPAHNVRPTRGNDAYEPYSHAPI